MNDKPSLILDAPLDSDGNTIRSLITLSDFKELSHKFIPVDEFSYKRLTLEDMKLLADIAQAKYIPELSAHTDHEL